MPGRGTHWPDRPPATRPEPCQQPGLERTGLDSALLCGAAPEFPLPAGGREERFGLQGQERPPMPTARRELSSWGYLAVGLCRIRCSTRRIVLTLTPISW